MREEEGVGIGKGLDCVGETEVHEAVESFQFPNLTLSSVHALKSFIKTLKPISHQAWTKFHHIVKSTSKFILYIRNECLMQNCYFPNVGKPLWWSYSLNSDLSLPQNYLVQSHCLLLE
ncbi:hypothetical protein AVEN_79356-1 [Araneus ventricosus]|uniref:Uncharacterized protein n=1 Tax=Araneus ventricosus TaxID=182803 RepID=A0A4Y2U513_ARAVE|nr:hypothetical protein AVEN_79356-1 [Araneus ventricosus]